MFSSLSNMAGRYKQRRRSQRHSRWHRRAFSRLFIEQLEVRTLLSGSELVRIGVAVESEAGEGEPEPDIRSGNVKVAGGTTGAAEYSIFVAPDMPTTWYAVVMLLPSHFQTVPSARTAPIP